MRSSHFLRGYGSAVVWLLTLSTTLAQSDAAPYGEFERNHWSLRPRQRVAVPQFAAAADRQWVRTPVDPFILERLQRAEMSPAEPAERGTLVRRLYFDLIGLPPSPTVVEQFVADQRPDAYERLVDRLLADPRHGEYWGQHWLDVVRYGETEGFEYDNLRPGAWRFRDYVIDSFNADKPFDQFVLEQLAGDEQPQADNGLLAAAGFHRLGPVRRNAGNNDVSFSRNEVLTEMTDAVGAVFLGMTLGCARCHDHKFDAIQQKDYYRMQAFLAAVHERDVQLAPADAIQRWNAETERIKAEMKKLRELTQSAEGLEREKLIARVRELEYTLPAPLPTISSVKHDADARTPIHVLHRGDAEKKREAVGPRPLGVLISSSTPELAADSPQPRTQLAAWLTSPDHPLTARVLVNRIWSYHFGEGIVATPNDFGLNGAAPSHSALLDDLANRTIEGGWQLKPLHRLLVTSAVYRQRSNVAMSATARRVDSSNKLLWQFRRRRLDAEQLRDSMLLIADRLNARLHGESILVPVENELVQLLYKPTQWQVTADRAEHYRRSVYLLAKRNLRVPFLEVFDQPDLQQSCAQRAASTHAPQALELLNGALANELADAFAVRLSREAGPEPAAQIDWAFRLVAGRAPLPPERELSLSFLRTRSPREFALAMFNLNAFLYVD